MFGLNSGFEDKRRGRRAYSDWGKMWRWLGGQEARMKAHR